jgi:hypothetical protein
MPGQAGACQLAINRRTLVDRTLGLAAFDAEATKLDDGENPWVAKLPEWPVGSVVSGCVYNVGHAFPRAGKS